MSLVIFIASAIFGFMLYSTYRADQNGTGKKRKSLDSRSSSTDSSDINICTIPGCDCILKEKNAFFRKFMSAINPNYKDPHALVHQKPQPFQFQAFQDRYKSLEDVTSAIRDAGLDRCRLILGIDFTASNEWQGRSTNKGQSLHHISSSSRSSSMNPYQHVIDILSRTLPGLMSPQEERDSNSHESRFPLRRKPKQLHCIHAYGFGDSVTKDKDAFPLNPAYVPCTSFEEVQALYRATVERVTLDGPTSYAAVINKAIEIVEEENKTFHILLIIADGQFVDEGPTVEAIIKASEYPFGIIVVGVGDGPWNLLYRFDDWLPQRRFDNFQFVEYTKVMRDFGPKHADTALALHALMEIPDQYGTVKRLGLLEEPPNESTPSNANDISSMTGRQHEFS